MTHRYVNPYARLTKLTAPKVAPQVTRSRPMTASEIIPGHLWQSGCPTPELLKELKPDVVIDCRWFADGPLPDMLRLATIADSAAVLAKGKSKILIHCEMGINRSSLLVCLILLRLNPEWSGAQAIAYLTKHRSPVLTNNLFRQFITALQPMTVDPQ